MPRSVTRSRVRSVIIVAFCIAACFAIVAIVTTVTAQRAHKGKIVVTEKDNGATVRMSEPDLLLIQLSEQPGVGYQWKLLPNDGVVKLSRTETVDQESKPGHAKPGGHILRTFIMKPISKGETTIQLLYVYQRPPPNPPITTLTFTLKVRVQ